METKDRDSRQGSEEGVEKSNVVRLPRDWLGPRDELVPFGPSAYRDRPEVDQHLSEVGSPSLTQDDFWGGDLDAVPRPVIGPKPADGFSVRRRAAGEPDVAGADRPASLEGDGFRSGRWRHRPRLPRPPAGGAFRLLGWPGRPSLPAIHFDWGAAAVRRRAGVVGLAMAVVVGAAVLGLNLIAPSHRAGKLPQIAGVWPSGDGLIAGPPHVAALPALRASKSGAIASRARTHPFARSSVRSTSHRSSHQSSHVTYVARVTPAQSYQPAPAQPVVTPAVSEAPTPGQSATTARQTSSSAAGPTGLGSQVGTDCNPKCR